MPYLQGFLDRLYADHDLTKGIRLLSKPGVVRFSSSDTTPAQKDTIRVRLRATMYARQHHLLLKTDDWYSLKLSAHNYFISTWVETSTGCMEIGQPRTAIADVTMLFQMNPGIHPSSRYQRMTDDYAVLRCKVLPGTLIRHKKATHSECIRTSFLYSLTPLCSYTTALKCPKMRLTTNPLPILPLSVVGLLVV